ncbi:MAG TPA: hypothetical protein VE028_09415 [Nitratidesulfovibrio sp.]|nr:hypothetical protein [Nitratidesulfovibrio sp.]
MDNSDGVRGSFGNDLFSQAMLFTLVGSVTSAVFAAALSFGPLSAQMFELICMVGGAYAVSAIAWHYRLLGAFRSVLPYLPLLALVFWGGRNIDGIQKHYSESRKSPFEQDLKREPQRDSKSSLQSKLDEQRHLDPNGTDTGVGTRDSSTVPVRPKPPDRAVKRDVYRKGVTVNVRARGVDSLLAESVRSIVTDRVGAVQALRDRYVKVEVDDLYMSDQEGPTGKGFGSTKAYAVVRLAAYATDSGTCLYSVQGDGDSPIYFQGQAKPVDTMKKEALSDALESAFRQIR